MSVTTILWGNKSECVVPTQNKIKDINYSSDMKDLLLGACLCNNATKPSTSNDGNENLALEMTNENLTLPTSKVVGDAVDVALYRLCQDKCSINVEQIKK